MVTPFAAFCLLFTTGVLAQLAGFVFTCKHFPCTGFWLLAAGTLGVGGAALVDGDPTLLLGQGLVSAILWRTLWSGKAARVEAALPQRVRQYWRDHASLCKQTLVFGLVVLAVLALPLLAPDTTALHAFISRITGVEHDAAPSLRAQAVYVLVAALLLCVAVPRQALSFVAGLLFGAFAGTVLATLATTLGCAMAFGTSRLVTRSLERRRSASLTAPVDTDGASLLRRLATRYRPQYTKLSALLQRAPFLMTVLVRLFPSGSNLLFSLLAGAMRLPALPVIAGSCVGYIPQNLIFSLLGSGLTTDGTWRIVAGVLLFAITAALGVWVWKKTPQS